MGPGSMVLIVAAVIVAAAAWLYYGRNKEVVSPVEVLNQEGDLGTALVVYHPGKSRFQRSVISAFAEGLASRGWRVAMTTASREAPTDLSGYDLLVLGSPTYGFTPSVPIRRYLTRLGDLGGQATITIVTGMGAGERSSGLLGKKVREANGELVDSLLLYWMRPNDDDNYVNTSQNRALAAEMAKKVAQDILPPGKDHKG